LGNGVSWCWEVGAVTGAVWERGLTGENRRFPSLGIWVCGLIRSRFFPRLVSDNPPSNQKHDNFAFDVAAVLVEAVPRSSPCTPRHGSEKKSQGSGKAGGTFQAQEFQSSAASGGRSGPHARGCRPAGLTCEKNDFILGPGGGSLDL
jgi:hypothetical protein